MPKKQHDRPHLRWMIRRDTAEVVEAMLSSVSNGWSEDELVEALCSKRTNIGMVVELHEAVVGCMVYELKKDCLHVLQFAVNAKNRGMGVATAMVKKLADKLNTRRKKIIIEIRESNLPALQFFRAQGFMAVKLLQDYYNDDSHDDAIVLEAYRGEFAEEILNA